MTTRYRCRFPFYTLLKASTCKYAPIYRAKLMTNLIPFLCMCRTVVAQLIPIIHPIKADDIM